MNFLEWEDGPSWTLYEFMENWKFRSPQDWHGVRKLTSK